MFQGQILLGAFAGLKKEQSIQSLIKPKSKKLWNLNAMKKAELFQWNIIPSFHAPEQMSDSGLRGVLCMPAHKMQIPMRVWKQSGA